MHKEVKTAERDEHCQDQCGNADLTVFHKDRGRARERPRAVGLRARRDEADAFMNAADEYAAIGDCVKARTVEWCTKEAFYAAINL